MRKILFLALMIMLVLGMCACGDKDNDISQNGTEVKGGKYDSVTQNPIVTINMKNGDTIKMELYPKIAPQTVENFVSLIKSGFYDGLTFHRVIPDFMVQGGDPKNNGTGGPGYTIFGEFSANGFENSLKHDIGVLSMARSEEYNTVGSQFFIVTNAQSYQSLDTLYPAFGKVIEGMDAVNKIASAEVKRVDYSEDFQTKYNELASMESTDDGYEEFYEEVASLYSDETMEMNHPVEEQVMESVTVETFGVVYDEPSKITN